MKHITIVLISLLFAVTGIMAQTVNQFKYQAVLRNAGGVIMSSEAITVDVDILQDSAAGASVFSENHSLTTSAQGLININIGSVNDMSIIDWSTNTYFVKISVNGTVMGTSQLLSVPYAINAKTAETVNYNNLTNKPDLSVYATINMGNANITNLADPVNDQDAVTKSYFDTKILELEGLLYGVTDYDGKFYKGVKIGNQIWMAENLNVTHFPNGDPIPLVTDNTAWGNLADNNTDDAYCYYNNNASGEAATYGALYTYSAAIGDNWTKDNTANQGVCPDGWHLPADEEWTELADYLGGISVAGGKLKEIGTTHWDSPNTGATNETGYSALPGGTRYSSNGSFISAGCYSNWWSATEISGTIVWKRSLYCFNAEVGITNNDKSYGFSVRCVKD